jgi:hypothetical protein
MAQMAECLPNKFKALSLSSVTITPESMYGFWKFTLIWQYVMLLQQIYNWFDKWFVRDLKIWYILVKILFIDPMNISWVSLCFYLFIYYQVEWNLLEQEGQTSQHGS